MNLNYKTQIKTETKINYLIDSDSVAREKRYKLGQWFHGEYREKFKKPLIPANQS